MNREIKFRAWLKNECTMITQADYHDCIMICNGDGFGIVVNENWLKADEFVIMQFTGSVDSNSVDIYKGDIIKIDRYDEPIFGEVKQLDGGQYYINHEKVSLKYQYQIHCEICETDTPVFFLHFFDVYELEVIGNIYENTELIP